MMYDLPIACQASSAAFLVVSGKRTDVFHKTWKALYSLQPPNRIRGRKLLLYRSPQPTAPPRYLDLSQPEQYATDPGSLFEEKFVVWFDTLPNVPPNPA